MRHGFTDHLRDSIVSLPQVMVAGPAYLQAHDTRAGSKTWPVGRRAVALRVPSRLMRWRQRTVMPRS
jgi:hypothetical protein